MSPSNFPAAFFEVLRRVRGESAKIPLPGLQEAKAMRMRFYGLKRALKAHAADPRWSGFAETIQDVSVFIRPRPAGGFFLEFIWRPVGQIDPSTIEFSPREESPYDVRPGEVSHAEMMRRADHALALLNKSLAEDGGKVLTMAPDNATIQPVDSPKAIVAQEGGSTFAFVPEGTTSSTTIKEK